MVITHRDLPCGQQSVLVLGLGVGDLEVPPSTVQKGGCAAGLALQLEPDLRLAVFSNLG